MICSLSADDKNYSVYIKLYKYLAAKLNTLMNDPNASISVDDIMKSMYEDVFAKTNDHELAVRFARMVPTAVFNIAGKNMQKISAMMAKGFDPTATARIASEALNSETGISFVEDKLGLSANIAQKAKNALEGKPTVKRTRKKPVERKIPEGSVAKDQLTLFDKEGNPIVAKVATSKTATPTDIFEAVAPHAFKDTDNEALSMDPNSKNFNVKDPAKKMQYTVKRNIVRLVREAGVGSEINYPGVGPVFLQARNKDSIPAKFLPSDPEGLMASALVIVDKFGDQVLFNEKGEVDKNGRPAIYVLRKPHDIMGKYEQERITALSEQAGITKEAATDILVKEREVVNKIIDYVQKNESNYVTMNIDGGSLGVYGNAPAPYFLSSVNLPTDAINITRDNRFNYQFTLPSLSDQPIKIAQSEFKDRPDVLNFIADLLTERVFSGVELLNDKQKRDIVEKYLMIDSSSVSILPAGGLIIENNKIDTSTPEAIETAKQMIKKVLTSLRPFGKPLSTSQVNNLVSKGAKLVESADQGEYGDILVSQDQNTGEKIYRKLSRSTLNITDKGLAQNTHYVLQRRADGNMNIEAIKEGYVNNYIKENFKIDKLLNADNQLVQLNAYFTFIPLDSETTKIDNYDSTKDEKEIGDFEKDLLENKKKQREEYDALPAEMKKAIEILNQADTTMPGSGIAYTLQVAKVLEKNLKNDLYTREEAEAIVEYLGSKEINNYVPIKRHGNFNFTGNVLNIAKSNVIKYTKPTATTQPTATPVSRKTYSGKVTSLQPNQIFVFGSNPLGINGNPAKGTGGAALVAYNIAGVKQGEKMDNKLSDSGKAWGITTVTAPGKKRSKTPEEITEGIKKLYGYAKQNPTKEFLVSDYSATNLNGYTGQEMADMFNAAGPIPSNIVFNENFDKLVGITQPTVQPVGKVKEGVTELFESNPELANAVYEALGFNKLITPNDRIVFGHPTIGKSFLKKQGEDKFISLDDDYATEINNKVKEIADKYNVTTYQVKDGGTQKWNNEYNQMMQEMFNVAKQKAISENKTLFTSNTNLLRNNSESFDKVINLTDKEFQRRIQERGAKYDTQEWKSQINEAISKLPANKVINTDKYLSDLFITPQQKQHALQLYSQYLDTIFPVGTKQDIEGFKNFVSTQQQASAEPTVQVENPADAPVPPASTVEEKRKIESRKADASTNKLKKEDENYLGRPDSSGESEELFNSTIIGRSNGKITQKDIDTARDWYKQLTFKDPKTGKTVRMEEVFPFQEAFNLVNQQNPDSIATWTWNGITLYKGSNHTELYHEAFHGFVNAFLSKQEKDSLFDEVRKMTGTFRNFEGKMIPFSLATPKEVEEYLAEQFRVYMISNGRMSIANAPARKSFFKKLLNILELLFGNLTIAELYADGKANSQIKTIYENLRKGDLSSYNFNVPENRFNNPSAKFDSTTVQAIDSTDQFANLSKKDTKLLLDSIDGWIAQSMEAANSDLTTEQEIEDFLKLQVDMMMNRLSPAEMERQKLKVAKRLTYNQSVNYLKTKAGRTQAYKRVQYILSRLQNALNEEYAELKKQKAGENELQPVREKLGLVMFARENFGDVTDLSNNKVGKDGVIRGVIALHLAKSKNFGTEAIEQLDEEETPDEEKTRGSQYDVKSGAEVSQKELASTEVKYLFKTLYRMDPKTRMPITNELGAPELMDFNDIFGKVVTLLENDTDVVSMYNKLLKFAQQENPTEQSLAVAQLIGKLGPKGLDKGEFVHLQSRAVENLWTAFRNTMALARVPLVAQNIEKSVDKAGKTYVKSTVGRGINTYASVGKAWNSEFIWDKTEYVKQVDGVGNVLDIKAVLKKYPDPNSLKTGGSYDVEKVLNFLDAIGVKMSRTEEVKNALEFGSSELGIGSGLNGFRWVETLLSRNSKRVKDDVLNKADQFGDKINSAYVTGFSLLEILDKNGILITKPQDIFEQYKVPLVAGIDRSTGKELMISGLPGEGGNWRELQQIEGQLGSGVPSFMVTTADGNTKFEMSQHSTMSIMVSDVNSVEDTFEEDENGNTIRVSAYENLIRMPHMEKFDIDKNPNAKRYVWLTNMFNIVDSDGNPIPKDAKDYGMRKTTVGNKPVKLLLHDISGARTIDKDGVSSASADPYTKFILDFHLAVQKGLPELMRHSDKGTSYSVILNYITSPGGNTITGDVTQGQYVPNYKFMDSREVFHETAFDHYILPNLTSEHDRVRRFMKKKEEINATLKQIAEEKKAGKQITPTPVFDFNYLRNGQKFLMFEGILNADTKKQLSKVEGDLTAYFKDTTNEAAQKLKNKVITETRNYFEGQYNEVKALFNDFAFAADNLLENFSDQIYNKTGKRLYKDTSRGELEDALLNSWVYNSWIQNVESMNFLYGDIALYIHAKEEFHKRNAGIASSGVTFRTDSDYLDLVNNSEYGLGRKFEQQLTGKPMRIYDGTMNSGVMKDKITRSEYLEDLGFNLYNQMVQKAIAVNKIATVKRSVEEIKKDIKTKLFGSTHADITINKISDIEGIKPDSKSIMDNYAKMNEADAQGWISFDSYRILMDSHGQWSPAQEKIYLAMLRGEEIPADKVGTFFPPLKVQYWGTLANDPNNPLTDGVAIEAFHKFQLTPITPSIAATSPKLKTLHDKMMTEGMDYVLFESGSKVGTLTTVQFDEAGMPIRVTEDGKTVKSTDAAYNENLNIASIKDNIYTEDREINDDVPFTKNVIHVKYLKNQLNIEPKWKGKVTFATQIRKLIEVDLMENGIPTDFMVNDPLEKRIEKWLSLSFEEQLKESNNFKDVINYEEAVYKLTLNRKAQLLKKAQLTYNKKGELVGNLSNLVKYVKSQLTTQELADHELDFIDVDFNGDLKHDLSYSLSADKIERLLNALVVKAIIKQKVRGEGLIQVSGAMLEPQFRAATKEEQLKFGGTNGLAYYTISEDGTYVKAMKIKIAMQGDFKKLLYLPEVAVFEEQVDSTGKKVVDKRNKPVMKLNENASLVKLNELIKDENWLNTGDNRKLISAHGDRIPIQGLNSDEFAEIYEFLPETAGNIIILPAEIVAKSGGDFDIDKLTLIYPNISLDMQKDDAGNPIYKVSLYKTGDVEEYKKKYEKYKELAAEKILTEGYDNKIDKALAIFTHYKLFGGKEKVDSDIIDILLEEGELLDFEDFVLADQEKGLQNQLLFSMNKLSSKLENYSNLVRPNATDILDPIVDDLKKVYREYDPKLSTNDEANPKKGIQASKVFEITYNLYKQMTNNLGKKALGIGAIDNTYNELFNRIGMYLQADNRDLLGGKSIEEIEDLTQRAKEVYRLEKLKKEKGSEFTKEQESELKAAKAKFTKVDEDLLLSYERQTLYMPHNTMFKDKSISMSHRYDALGENKIGDVISQLMNGWVDIAKDPWIFYLKGNDKLGPMLLFLVQAGVPIKHAAYFISQPIITEYMNEVDRLRSVYSTAMQSGAEEEITRDKAILEAKKRVLAKLGVEIETPKKPTELVANVKKAIRKEMILSKPESEMFDLDDLYKQLIHVNDKYAIYDKKGRPKDVSGVKIDYADPIIADYQKSVFLHFLQIADMESVVKDVKLRTNVDTGKSGSLFEAQDKIVKLLELKRARVDEGSDSQTQYWRIPSAVIDRLIPTIKDEEGNDTGLLDETKISSPIASFYQQPFQLAIWKDLFKFRNNSVINKFLIDMSFTDKDKAKNNTYFEKDVELMAEFKNALLPMIFQNSFLSVDVKELMNPTKPVYFRGVKVEVARVEALPEWGVAFKDGVLYYDYNTLWDQFNSKTYLRTSPSGVAAINNADTFKTFGEYVKFVFEREYLRNEFTEDTFAKMVELRKSNPEFNEIWKSSINAVSKSDFLEEGQEIIRAGEPKRLYERARLKYAFEIYLRNKALKNAYNMHAIFNGDTAYAFEVFQHKSDKKYGKSLVNAFPVLKNLIPDSESNKRTNTERINLAFLEAPKDAETINSYYAQLRALSNPVDITKALPEISAEDAQKIADTFTKLPIIAFLQSGMSTSGRLSLNRVVDNTAIEAMLLPEVDKFLKTIESENSNKDYSTLKSMMDTFVKANKYYDGRGKNYVVPVGKDAAPTTFLDNKLFIEQVDNQKSFDPEFITSEGSISKPYSRIGDKVNFKTDRQTYNDATISNISWNGSNIVIDVTTLAKKENDIVEQKHQFFYTVEGQLIKYVTPNNKAYIQGIKEIETFDSILVKPEMLSGIEGFALDRVTEMGDTVVYASEYVKNGKPAMSYKDSTVVEIEDMHYNYNRDANNQLIYTSDSPLYRVKIQYESTYNEKTDIKTANFVVDANGKVYAKFNQAGQLQALNTSTRLYIKLRADRVKGDFIVPNLDTAADMIQRGIIPAGSIIDVIQPKQDATKDTGFFNQSKLYYLDSSTMTVKELDYIYEDEPIESQGFDIDSTNYFVVYNEAVNPGVSISATGASSVPLPKGSGIGNINIKDRYIHHSDFQNKAGVLSRNKYRGGAIINVEMVTPDNVDNQEFFYDDVDATGKHTINPRVKDAIDQSIETIKKMRDDKGLIPVFSKAGYGQYMIGADDSTGKMFKDKNGNNIGIAVAPETFKYLSTRLLEEFGYINPNFVREAEGIKEIVRVVKQPITDEEYSDLMNKCFA